MATSAFAVFKYNHTGRLKVGPLRAGIIAVLVACAGLAGFVVHFTLGIIGLIVAIGIGGSFWPRAMIVLGPRYLLCGPTIVFYRNVRALKLVPGKVLIIESLGKSLRVERERFPTGARKAHKIEANTRAKFDKVVAKIIHRVVNATPSVELRGIDRSAYLTDPAEQAKGKA